MSNRLRLNVDAVDDEIRDRGAGARIELQRDTTSAFSAPTNLANTTLVAAQTQYEFFDSAGDTSSWYRFRLASSTGTIPSGWSDPFRGSALAAHATLDSLREYLGLPDDSRDNLLSDLLVDASDYISAKVGHDFYRHPQVSGTEVRLFDGSGGPLIWVNAGIVSLTTVELATVTGASYSALVAADWLLYPVDKADDMSYRAVVLSDKGNYRHWYPGLSTVRLTGVFGWASVPAMVRKATLDLAREWYRQGPGGGGPVGVNQFGTPIFGGGEPKSVRDVVERYGQALVA